MLGIAFAVVIANIVDAIKYLNFTFSCFDPVS